MSIVPLKNSAGVWYNEPINTERTPPVALDFWWEKMTREALLSWVPDCFGADWEYPWGDDNAVIRHRENRKWFAVILTVGRDKLGIPGDGTVDVVNVKCDPRLIGTLISQPGFHRAYHMNKEKWISIRLDGTVEEETVRMLITMSYDLTGQKTGKKRGGKEC